VRLPGAEPDESRYILNPVAGQQLLTAQEAISAIAQLSTELETDGLLRGATVDEMEAVIERDGRHRPGEAQRREYLRAAPGGGVRGAGGVGRVRNKGISRATTRKRGRARTVLGEQNRPGGGAHVHAGVQGS
jgi:hypothetical protein